MEKIERTIIFDVIFGKAQSVLSVRHVTARYLPSCTVASPGSIGAVQEFTVASPGSTEDPPSSSTSVTVPHDHATIISYFLNTNNSCFPAF